MKKLSIILISALVVLVSCTKSKEVHPENGDGNDEIVTVGMKDVHVKYTRTDHAELSRVVFHYSLADVQEYEAAEMTKRDNFFELTLNDLLSDTLYDYYYELFYNGGETSITNQKSFHTQAFDTPEPPTPPSGVPEGAINGLFTINANGDQVYFSQGNLQYQASTNTWRFAENQWDYVGDDTYGTVYENGVKCDNALISSTYDGWIDLFGWGTSGFNHGAICYQPWINNSISSDHYAYGNPMCNLYDQTGLADWGYNMIMNGGNTLDQWRTCSFAELDYILNIRTTFSGIRFVKAVINGIGGYLVLPDDWEESYYSLNCINEWARDYNVNTISISDWTNLEVEGAVFFPASGYREIEDGLIHAIGVSCAYWSASVTEEYCVHSFYSYTGSVGYSWPFPNGQGSVRRNIGYSVRLVQNAK